MQIKYIGDTHIGKRFKTGVPLNRLGEREALILKLFEEQLNQEADMIIHLGDLFDSPVVSYDDLMTTHDLIRSAAKRNHKCSYVFLAGNHDISRVEGKVAAFQILSKLFSNQDNVEFVYDEPFWVDYTETVMAFPYQNYDKIRQAIIRMSYPTYICCGHFDEPFPEDIFNKFKEVHTGHIHTAKQVGNITVHGSIIPMSFAEDPHGDLYRTVTLKEFEDTVNDPLNEEWQNICFRVILEEGESLPENVSCRQLISIKKEVLDAPEYLTEDIDEASLDMEKLFHEALDETGLFSKIYENYLRLKLEQKD